MHKIVKWAFWLLVVFFAIFIGYMIWANSEMPVISPQGLIGKKQSKLLLISVYLMLIVVVPVFILTVFVVCKYRTGLEEPDYDPSFHHSTKAEIVWWGVPFLIIVVLSFLTWKGCHELDPFRPLDSEVKPLTVQVVALQWKWLFIYPEQKIAVINFLQIPEKTPIHFEITSDAPMNSFWIPALGGQIYAMSGMKSQLHLIADEVGRYRGLSANISGDGFSGMHFVVEASGQDAFENWIKTAQSASKALDWSQYEELVRPSQYDPVSFYRLKDLNLFEQVLMKYMMPEAIR